MVTGMSEKRFRLIRIDDYVFQIHDIDNDMYLVAEQICNLLNEQQSIIGEQKIAINEMITDYKNLEKENEQLKKRIALFEKQEDEFEQYTAQTIENMIANYRDDW